MVRGKDKALEPSRSTYLVVYAAPSAWRGGVTSVVTAGVQLVAGSGEAPT